MCCIRINTDVLLANLFGSEERKTLSVRDIDAYIRFLARRFPSYLVSDFSEYKLVEAAEKYPKFYRIADKEELSVKPGKKVPDRDLVNEIYPGIVSNYLKNLTDLYMREYILV